VASTCYGAALGAVARHSEIRNTEAFTHHVRGSGTCACSYTATVTLAWFKGGA
jgi:hypothetical protein